jgi:hypothetical protein
VLLDRVEQGHRLEAVARRARARLLGHAPLVDRLLDAGHDQLGVHLGDHPIAVLEDLWEVVTRIHVHDRKREAGGMEGLARQAQQHGGVLAAREQQHPAPGLGGHLTDDVNGLRLECAEV